MRSAIRRCLFPAVALSMAAAVQAPDLPYFSVLSEDPGAWPEILASIGFEQRPAAVSRVFVARAGSPASAEWRARVEGGAVLILEGESSLAGLFGFRRSRENVKVASVSDVHRPSMRIIWEKGLELPVFEVPKEAHIFARERWTGAPLTAGYRQGSGAVLWIAAPPGESGYERFPYLLQALADLGIEPPFRSNRLWAFLDTSYRSRVDLEYFARRWRESGIAALHVAAWHFWERDSDQDRYLEKLIEACHREGILVYAWLELPHVSEKFWESHSEWREKTAVLQDAHLDWRKLMNLTNRACFHAVAEGLQQLASRFDWDGINLAELYFESLEGIDNPSRFTPMNDDVRAQFRRQSGFDPIELFKPVHGIDRQAVVRAFLDYRTRLAGRMQEEWLAEIEAARRAKPHLDLVLTHVDDRIDTGMRDAIGADAARVLPLLDSRSFTFLIEDPATVWHLGPRRYETISERYRGLTRRHDKLAIDINIVDRYQNVYPTKQQTGAELLQLIHYAAQNFQRVALYFESSLLPPDLKLLPSAAAAAKRIENMGDNLVVESHTGIGLPWKGGAVVDGLPWPLKSDDVLWLPAGAHIVESGTTVAPLQVIHLNGDLKSARIVNATTIEFAYQSTARAIALLDRPAVQMEIDGAPASPVLAGPKSVILPRGQHVVTISTHPGSEVRFIPQQGARE